MADTLKFGPEWLRALSDGNTTGVATPPPSLSPGFGKYKLAEHRYGREEMLALFDPKCEIPEELESATSILVKEAQNPLAIIPLSEEEQRILSQSVNSTAVLRMFGRGGPPGVRGGRGMERGRGRGRGRGDGGLIQRGISYEENSGGFNRHPRDGWEEVGSKRSFHNRYEDTNVNSTRREFSRSLSNENWREKDDDGGEEENDWRKAGNSKWGNRGSWRDPKPDFDSESGRSNGIQRMGYGRSYQKTHAGESWDEDIENMPEWSVDDDLDEPGTFDSSGAFVSKKVIEKNNKNDKTMASSVSSNSQTDNSEETVSTKSSAKDVSVKGQAKENFDKVIVKDKCLNEKESDEKNSTKSEVKKAIPHMKSPRKEEEVTQKETKNSPSKENTRTHSSLVEEDKSKESMKQKSELEALDKMKEAAENMVLKTLTNENENDNILSERKSPQLVVQPSSLPPSQNSPTPKDKSFHQWYYLDPQGDVQGPFTSGEMLEWFTAGYFTMSLKVKRVCDEVYSPLGELIKLLGKVPFVGDQNQSPRLKSPRQKTSPDVVQQQQHQQQQQQQQMSMIQQQYFLHQQHIMQQTMLLRHMQLTQIQQIMIQLQEKEEYKNLPPNHLQSLAMQIMLEQQPQQPVPATTIPISISPAQMSSSNDSHLKSPTDMMSTNMTPSPMGPFPVDPSIVSSASQPPKEAWNAVSSVWEIENKPVVRPSSTVSPHQNIDMEKQNQSVLEEKRRLEELKQAEELQKKEEEIRAQQLEIQRQKEEMEKELQRKKEEMEKQRLEIEEQIKQQILLQQQKEAQIKAETERRQREEEQKRKEEEERRKREEEERQRLAEEHKRKEEEARRKQEELLQKEIKRQEMLRQQEQEKERLQLLELEKQKESQRQQELRQQQQQEALRKLQQEQLQNIQLPSHAQWGSQQAQLAGNQIKSLLEIQQQEEIDREREQSSLEIQRQQMFALQQQQQQQQQQKSWTSQVTSPQSSKSLLEIQEEQARQLNKEKKKRQEIQQNTTKNLPLGTAGVWGGVTSASHWASEGAWGNTTREQASAKTRSQTNNTSASSVASSSSMGFWDDAIISSKPAKPTQGRTASAKSGDFPVLRSSAVSDHSHQVNAAKNNRIDKTEEAVKKLFQKTNNQTDDFTAWCENALKDMAASIDVPTFVTFLKEVDSPFEVHDYVRSYLGEGKASVDFAKQFLEKRSQNRNKVKQQKQQAEDSIWGPAPARDFKQPTQISDSDNSSRNKNKKKKKMVKLDASILGFTVHADSERKNIGEIDDITK